MTDEAIQPVRLESVPLLNGYQTTETSPQREYRRQAKNSAENQQNQSEVGDDRLIESPQVAAVQVGRQPCKADSQQQKRRENPAIVPVLSLPAAQAAGA